MIIIAVTITNVIYYQIKYNNARIQVICITFAKAFFETCVKKIWPVRLEFYGFAILLKTISVDIQPQK